MQTLNFTQFAKLYGYTSDYAILDHSEISLNGTVSKASRKAANLRMQARMESNQEGHAAFIGAIRSGEVVDADGVITIESLNRQMEAGKEARRQVLRSNIKTLLGLAARGMRPKAHKDKAAELQAVLDAI